MNRKALILSSFLLGMMMFYSSADARCHCSGYSMSHGIMRECNEIYVSQVSAPMPPINTRRAIMYETRYIPQGYNRGSKLYMPYNNHNRKHMNLGFSLSI